MDSRRRLGRLAALSLTVTRIVLAPVVLVAAATGHYVRWIALAVIVAALSDVYDGKIARHFGVASAGLRRFDSIADTVFYTGVGLSLWLSHPDIVRSHAVLLIAFVVMQVAGHAVDVWKFGRDTSYHTWSGRAFGLMLFVSMTLIFWTGQSGGWLTAALIVGMLAHLDAFVITMVLPEWDHDVHTIRNAGRIRRAVMRRRMTSTAPP